MGADGHRFRLVRQEASRTKCPSPRLGALRRSWEAQLPNPGGEGWEATVLSQPHPLQDTLSPPSCRPSVVPLVLCFNIKFQKVMCGLGLPRDEL